MPDFDEARRQDVEKKASDELDGIECQDLTAVPILRVPPAKSDVIIMHFKQASVGDGHPVGVASEIAQNMLRSAEGRLGVDHPFFLPELLKPGVKANRISNCLHPSKEVELFLGIRLR
jgi:hypothetical protein